MTLVDKIDAYGERKIAEEIEATVAKDRRVCEMIEEIKDLEPRIRVLVDVGNACIRNCIPIEKKGSTQSYETHQFVSNGWSHLTGLILEGPHGELTSLERMKNQTTVVGVGKIGGGACDFNLEVLCNDEGGIDVKVSGDAEYVLNKFLSEFDAFEAKFTEYVEGYISK